MTQREQDKLRLQMRVAMQERNMTAATLSNLSGVGYLTVRRYLNSKNDTSADKLVAMLDVLGFDITRKELTQ